MLPTFSIVLIVLLGIIFMFFQTEKMEQSRILEEKRQEVMDKLANNLSHFNPVLDAFVDTNYKTTSASKISSEGIVEYDRGLAKSEAPFGNYLVKYDLNNMEVVSGEIKVTNPDYSEEWRDFQKENKK
jgi:maltodextrin utilization protein YvdJ